MKHTLIALRRARNAHPTDSGWASRVGEFTAAVAAAAARSRWAVCLAVGENTVSRSIIASGDAAAAKRGCDGDALSAFFTGGRDIMFQVLHRRKSEIYDSIKP